MTTMSAPKTLALIIVVLVCMSGSPVFAQPAVDIGSRLELFVDKHLIDTFEGASLRLHQPVPLETVLAFDKPWEGRYCGYVTVLKDGDLYRLYYRGLPNAGKDGSNAETTCYAESKDGITFTKPSLGIFNVEGSTENNVILADAQPYSHNFAPFIDARPGCPPEERFKAVGGTQESGLVGFVSADGTHWKKLREDAIIKMGALDSQNVVFWSQSEKCYVCYLRTFTKTEEGGFRTVSRTTSPDFIKWTDLTEMTYGDTPREHLYTNQTHAYFRAPHIYIAIAARFMPGRRILNAEQAAKVGSEGTYSGDCSDTILMTTRGGTQYDRTFMEAFVRPGIGLGNWTSRTNYPARCVVPTGDDTMSMYVQRNYGQPTHHLQRLAMRTDGFISVNAPYAGGSFRTRPFTFSGKNLVINYSTSAAGSVWVEVQDEAGAPIGGFAQADCDEIIGDEIARTVTWKGNADVSALAGKPVRLRFVMKDADLYSIQFHE